MAVEIVVTKKLLETAGYTTQAQVQAAQDAAKAAAQADTFNSLNPTAMGSTPGTPNS